MCSLQKACCSRSGRELKESAVRRVIDVRRGFGLHWLCCILEVLKVFKLYLWLRFFRHKIQTWRSKLKCFSGLVWRRDGDAVLVAETQPVCTELLWKHVPSAGMRKLKHPIGTKSFLQPCYSFSPLINMFNFKLTITASVKCATDQQSFIVLGKLVRDKNYKLN